MQKHTFKAPQASTEAGVLFVREAYSAPSCEAIRILPACNLMDSSFSTRDWQTDPDEIE